MASEKQFAANRRNAAKSTGPITQTGKLQSRRNAMRHGLTAATVVPAMEDVEEFEEFEAAIRADYQPTSAIEHELVARLTSLLWRLRRSTLIETNLFKLQARLAKDKKFKAEIGTDGCSPGIGGFYGLLSGPVISLPSNSMPAGPEATMPEAAVPNHNIMFTRHPNPGTIFLRLCNLNSFPLERINRYETALWRQAMQTLFLLDVCRKRLPPPNPQGPRSNHKLGSIRNSHSPR